MQRHTIDGIGLLTGQWPLQKHRPSLIFLHGAGQSARFWEQQIDALTGQTNTVALDLPGHGASRGPGADDVVTYARSVEQLLNTLTPPLPVICGLSMGGAVALELLIRRKVPLCGGILISSGARLRVAPAVFEAVAKADDSFLNLLVAYAVPPRNRSRSVVDQLAACTTAPATVAAGDFTACDRFDRLQQLDRIRLPVLVIGGDQDQLTPPKYARYLHEKIADSRLATISQAGHFAPLEQPLAVNRALGSFIEEIHRQAVASGTT
jgi:pimeloyl-ACP methyl ester carboxylesterase